MATAQAVRVKEEAITEQRSMVLVRNLLRTTVSSVCYLRHLFPEDCFVERNLEGINIKSLVAKPGEDSGVLIEWLEKGVFEALRLKYLERMVFAITRTDPMDADEVEVLEQYSFDITYPDNSPQVQVVRDGKVVRSLGDSDGRTTKAAAKKATMSLLRSVITLTQTLGPLPDQRFLTMNLFYTKETPEDYQPTYFKDVGGTPFSMMQSAMKCRLGEVDTKYHTVKLRVKSVFAGDQEDVPLALQAQQRQEGKGKGQHQGSEKEDEGEQAERRASPSDLLPLMRSFVLADANSEPREFTTNQVQGKFPQADTGAIKEGLKALQREGVIKSLGANRFAVKHSGVSSSQQEAIREAELLKHRVMLFLASQEIANVQDIVDEVGVSSTVVRPLLNKLFKDGLLGKVQRRTKGGSVKGGRLVLPELREAVALHRRRQGANEVQARSPVPDSEGSVGDFISGPSRLLQSQQDSRKRQQQQSQRNEKQSNEHLGSRKRKNRHKDDSDGDDDDDEFQLVEDEEDEDDVAFTRAHKRRRKQSVPRQRCRVAN